MELKYAKLNFSNGVQSMCIVALLLFFCMSSYSEFLNGTFVFDDTVAVVKNTIVNTLPTNFSALFRHDYWGKDIRSEFSHKSYRPLTTLMFHVERTYFNWEAKGMKAINLGIHCVNTILVWRLFMGFKFKTFSTIHIATLAAALFAVHPVHAEPVCGIVGRADLMCCLLYISALLLTEVATNTILQFLYVGFLVIMLSGIGMLFKESAATIPLAFILISYIRNDRKQQACHVCLRNCFLLVACFGLIFCRLAVQNFDCPKFKKMDNPVSFNADLLTRTLSQNYIYMINVWILFCPQWLSFDWAFECIQLITTFEDLRFQSVFFVYALLVVVVLKHKHHNGLMLGIILLVVPFMPATGIIKVGFVVAERVLYVPSIGFCLIVSYSFVHVKKTIRKHKWLVFIFRSLFLLICISYIFRTRERGNDWLTEENLFTSALKVCKLNAKIHYNIARLATNNLHQRKAFYHYHKAVELYPQYESALMNLGNLYRENGDLQIAEHYIKASLEVVPNFSAAWMNLGIVQTLLKKFSNAEQSYKNALGYRRNYAICHYNLGNLYLELKRFAEAMKQWETAITINPQQPQAWINILTMLDRQELYECALRLSKRALTHLSNNTSILFVRANIFGKLQHYTRAENLYKLLIEIEPQNFLFHTNLGVLYHRWNKLEAAAEHYNVAVEINFGRAETARKYLQELLKNTKI